MTPLPGRTTLLASSTTSGRTCAFGVPITTSAPNHRTSTLLFLAKRDSSRAGTKRGRLDKLAERQEELIETDKGLVLKAAGGFVGLIVVLLIAATAGGVFDELLLKAM